MWGRDARRTRVPEADRPAIRCAVPALPFLVFGFTLRPSLLSGAKEERSMNSRTWLVRVAAFVSAMALAAGSVFAQGGATSTIAGSVTDASGGIIPGADIVAKNNATSAESRAVSSEQGTFAIPALNAGTYTVTVTLAGFKTVVLNEVVLNAGVPASVKAILEVGGLSETV